MPRFLLKKSLVFSKNKASWHLPHRHNGQSTLENNLMMAECGKKSFTNKVTLNTSLHKKLNFYKD
jgi:hypothetical protein